MRRGARPLAGRGARRLSLPAMSVPEVEALVSQKYEIKRRLGKGVSALGRPRELGEPGGGVQRCPAGRPGGAFVCGLPVPAAGRRPPT